MSPVGRAAAPRGIQKEAWRVRGTGVPAQERAGQQGRVGGGVPEGWRGFGVAGHGEEGGEGT